MHSTKLTVLLAAAAAAVSLAAPAAQAQSVSVGTPTVASGRGCSYNGRTLEDGQINTFRMRYERGTVTCTDGTVCVTWTVIEPDGSTAWFSECTESPSSDDAVTAAAAVPKTTVAGAR